MKNFIHITKCWTGRRWINIGSGFLAIGFGPNKFIERVMWRGKYILVWHHDKYTRAA